MSIEDKLKEKLRGKNKLDLSYFTDMDPEVSKGIFNRIDEKVINTDTLDLVKDLYETSVDLSDFEKKYEQVKYVFDKQISTYEEKKSDELISIFDSLITYFDTELHPVLEEETYNNSKEISEFNKKTKINLLKNKFRFLFSNLEEETKKLGSDVDKQVEKSAYLNKKLDTYCYFVRELKKVLK